MIAVSLIIFTWACDKNYNEEPDVTFNLANKYQFNGSSLTIIDTAYNLVKFDASGAMATTAPMVGDTMMKMNSNYSSVEGDNCFIFIEGRANGLVFYPGDSTGATSRRYDDYPFADNDATYGIREFNRGGYNTPGNYTAKLVATNFYDANHDPKEKVYTINVIVYSREELEDFYYNVLDTGIFKDKLGIADSIGFDDIFSDVFLSY